MCSCRNMLLLIYFILFPPTLKARDEWEEDEMESSKIVLYGGDIGPLLYVNDSRLQDLQWQADTAWENGDKCGKKILQELRTRRSMPELHWPAPAPTRRKVASRWVTHSDPSEKQMTDFIVRLMQDSVYQAQEKLKYLDGPLNKHGRSFRFQIGYTLRVIEELRNDIRKMYTQLRRDEYKRTTGWLGMGYNMYTANSYLHLFYYSHAFKKFIDITYIVEQICDKFDRYTRTKKKLIKHIVHESFKQQFG